MAELIPKPVPASRIRCLVVDDESIAIKGIVNYIDKLDFLETAACCSSALEAAEILKKRDIDLMFLDINMPHLSGLEFLEALEKPPLTIITTAYSEYALEGFRLQVVDYLLKPIAFQRFFQAVSKAQTMFRSQLILGDGDEGAIPDMYVRQGDAFLRIDWQDILYAEGMQNYVKLHFRDKILTIHQTMASLEEILPKNHFFRIHRSYLINIAHIHKISGGEVIINGSNLPIAKPKRQDLLNAVVYKNLISK
ncbi:MAG: LytTR family DNA-binding domain-containing protein [Candidatus Pseudobacter hemicellulosilyticus]|uniref:LytTR family DNA-binding domain-containing protein n=1 Tax=Candidatus Pseudobacter hemicellulosilyticus TaxID=3121375 RepID=A0AAJ5WPL7_9BACT|nr:MAG: LytTR family DNA-binding domain-containing protein [Pseudobacter sp.]